MEEKIRRNRIIQICVLARDVSETARRWADFFRVELPPVTITEDYEVTHARYKGEPCHGKIWQACFDLENIQIEIVGPAGDEPSVWRDWLDQHGEGLHHIAFFTEDMDKAIETAGDEGYGLLQRGSWPAQPKDGEYAYLDTCEKLKCCIELLSF